MPFLKIVEEFLYRRTGHTTGHQVHDDLDWNLWISRELVPDVLNTAFDKPLYSHGGINKTLKKIRKYCFCNIVFNTLLNRYGIITYSLLCTPSIQLVGKG